MKELHKLIYGIKCISIFLQAFQNYFLLPGTVFHFFFHYIPTLFYQLHLTWQI